MKVPRFGGGNQRLFPFDFKSFRGLNVVDNNTDMAHGQFPAGENVDPSRILGALAKRQGTTALFDSLGAGGCKGTHTYRRSSGDRLLFAHGTDLYRLSGTTKAFIINTDTEYNDGTHSDTQALNNSLILGYDNKPGSYFGLEVLNTYGLVRDTDIRGQSFTTEAGQYTLKAISVQHYVVSPWVAGENVTMSLYKWDTDYVTTKAGAVLGTVTINGPQADGWVQFEFADIVDVLPSTMYFFELTINTGVIAINKGLGYSGGSSYVNGVAESDDLLFRVYKSAYKTSGTWISPVYDVETTPVSAVMSWNDTLPANTSIEKYVRGSSDGQNWGDWQLVVDSGDGVPLSRYIQTKKILATTINTSTPQLINFVIGCETSFTEATSIKSGLSGNKVRFKDYKDLCYFCDGGRPQVYDGTDVRDVGIDAPTTAPTLAVGAAGSLTGDYRGRVTFVFEDGAESNGGTESAVVTLTSDKINWSDIPLGPTGTVSRKLYRTKAGGSLYYFVTTISDNTTTTYTGDDTTDANLITPLELDNDIPPDSTIVSEFKNYILYVATDNPERLYFSKVGLPDNVPLLNYKEMPGPIKAVSVYADKVICQGERFARAIYGDIWGGEADNTSIKTISEETGLVSHVAAAEGYSGRLGGNVLLFPTRNGVVYLTPGLQEGSLNIIPLSEKIQPYFDGSINIENMAAVVYGDRYLIAINYNDPSEAAVYTNNVVFSLDLRTLEWSSPWTLNASGFGIANGNLYMADSTIGRLYQMFSGTSDAGANIEAYAGLQFKSFPRKTEPDHCKVHVKRGSVTDAMSIIARIDGVEGTITPGPCTDWTGSGGSARNIQDEVISPELFIPAGEGYTIGFEVHDDSTNDWILYAISGWVNPYQEGVY